MDLHRFRHTSFFAAGIAAATAATPAFAIEAEEVGNRLKAVLEQQDVELSYGDARLEGNNVVLNDITAQNAEVEGSVSIDQLVLQDVTEEPNGNYRVGTVEVESFETPMGEMTLSLIDYRATGLVLPEDLATDPFGGVMRYDRMEVARIDVEGQEGPVASLTNVYADIHISDDNTMETTGAVENYSFNLQGMFDDADTAAMVSEMGYGELSGSALMEGSWRPSDGRMTLSRYEAVVEDAGTLLLALDFAGYTPEFARTLEETARNLEEGEGASGNDNSMQGMAMLGLVQQLTFHSASIRFNDDGITEKALDEIASKRNTTTDDIITQSTTALQQQIASFAGSDLAETVSQAVGTFLENPQHFEISAQPDNPVPFAMLMGAAMGSPDMLVQQLGLSVTANQ